MWANKKEFSSSDIHELHCRCTRTGNDQDETGHAPPLANVSQGPASSHWSLGELPISIHIQNTHLRPSNPPILFAFPPYAALIIPFARFHLKPCPIPLSAEMAPEVSKHLESNHTVVRQTLPQYK